MARPIQIMKTASSPADPSAPSFLTTLPQEVRNAIYEVLFKRDEPVLLHNADAYYPEPPMRSNYYDQDDYLDALDAYDRAVWAGHDQDREFKHDFYESLPVLLCCRQMYHECVGVWYGSNTFVISRALHGHDDIFDVDDEVQHRITYCPTTFAPRWLKSLGSQLHLLRKVWIDCSATCPPDCALMCRLEVLPLVRIFWKYPHLQDVVAFAQTDRVLVPHVGRSTRAYRETTTHLLNTLLEQLAVKDSLKIKHYAISDHLLSNLEVFITSEAAFVYGSDSKELLHFSSVMADCGKFEEFQKGGFRPEFLSLPIALRAEILSRAGICPSGITFDLDTCTAHSLDLSIFQFDRTLRSSFFYAGLADLIASITLKMSSTSATTDFAHVTGLQLLRNHHGWYDPPIQRIMSSDILSHRPLIIRLCFKLAANAALTDLRIDIRDLFLSLFYLNNPHATIQISLNFMHGPIVLEETAQIKIATLQKDLFLLFSDVLEQGEKLGAKLYTEPLPDLWMNGRGTLIETVYSEEKNTSEFTVKNTYKTLSKPAKAHQSYYFPADLHDNRYGWGDGRFSTKIRSSTTGGVCVRCIIATGLSTDLLADFDWVKSSELYGDAHRAQ